MKLWNKIKRFFGIGKSDYIMGCDFANGSDSTVIYEMIATLVGYETDSGFTTATFDIDTRVCAASSEDCHGSTIPEQPDCTMMEYVYAVACSGSDCEPDFDEIPVPEYVLFVYVFWYWLAKENKFFMINTKLNHVKRWFSGVPP